MFTAIKKVLSPNSEKNMSKNACNRKKKKVEKLAMKNTTLKEIAIN